MYDYNDLNELGRTIIEHASICSLNWFSNDYVRDNDFKSEEIRSAFAIKFVENCNIIFPFKKVIKDKTDYFKFDYSHFYKFDREIYIFWALLILTVDKSDAQRHLKEICDFAHAFGFSNEKLEYISYVVKVVCEGHLDEFKGRVDEKYKKEENLEMFDDILSKYGKYDFKQQ